MRRWIKTVAGTFVVVGLSFSQTAHADVFCSFSINNVSIDADGSLNVGLASTNVVQWWLCNVGGQVQVNTGSYGLKTVTSDACKSLYSGFLTAKASGRMVTLRINGPANCNLSSLPGNDAAPPSPYPYNFIF